MSDPRRHPASRDELWERTIRRGRQLRRRRRALGAAAAVAVTGGVAGVLAVTVAPRAGHQHLRVGFAPTVTAPRPTGLRACPPAALRVSVDHSRDGTLDQLTNAGTVLGTTLVVTAGDGGACQLGPVRVTALPQRVALTVDSPAASGPVALRPGAPVRLTVTWLATTAHDTTSGCPTPTTLAVAGPEPLTNLPWFGEALCPGPASLP